MRGLKVIAKGPSFCHCRSASLGISPKFSLSSSSAVYPSPPARNPIAFQCNLCNSSFVSDIPSLPIRLKLRNRLIKCAYLIWEQPMGHCFSSCFSWFASFWKFCIIWQFSTIWLCEWLLPTPVAIILVSSGKPPGHYSWSVCL